MSRTQGNARSRVCGVCSPFQLLRERLREHQEALSKLNLSPPRLSISSSTVDQDPHFMIRVLETERGGNKTYVLPIKQFINANTGPFPAFFLTFGNEKCAIFHIAWALPSPSSPTYVFFSTKTMCKFIATFYIFCV